MRSAADAAVSSVRALLQAAHTATARIARRIWRAPCFVEVYERDNLSTKRARTSTCRHERLPDGSVRRKRRGAVARGPARSLRLDNAAGRDPIAIAVSVALARGAAME